MGRLLKILGTLCFLLLIGRQSYGQQQSFNASFEFYNDTFNLQVDSSIIVDRLSELSEKHIQSCYNKVNNGKYPAIVDSLLAYKKQHQLNDWLYYQLIRKTAEAISPKKDNYERYTFYKWFLLGKSGYDARLTIADNRIIFYVYNDEDISDIPFLMFKNRKYMCLNHHDYAFADLNKVPPSNMISMPDAKNDFSYKVTRMPDFKAESYLEKLITFNYKHKAYHFNVKTNPEVESIFKNYPGVDFEYYFNIPLSKETYGSLIPLLKKNVQGMKQKKGIDYLMRFTRYAFLYENDDENFGREKRLSPEGTLFAKYSDCDDRAALFFYLVKEIYNLPMIAMLYPTHITMAVQFDTPIGRPILYNGKVYSVCEPTPQKENLNIGQLSASLKDASYKVVYAYEPIKL
ncbi:hypothetical protein [Pedobacter psychroterrae]|uniref:Transglutaminase superfamily protein n=1 Tax=Pedobacter psychroterrae TaxID=2530453 RepID=A0A4R0NUB7_9SPHI|nr:hypothetical protein [Pedobacter psychroterrae]TCD03789.1 hypothetical protein EZ437_07500 [Pedobacter psychroterrae]